MELAIINGTYRDSNTKVAAAAGTVYPAKLVVSLRAHALSSILCGAEQFKWSRSFRERVARK